MPRGGRREGAGRKKQTRATDAGVAEKVLAKAHAEQTWLSLIQLEKNRLGIAADGKLKETKKSEPSDEDEEGVIDGPDYQGRFSIIPLVNLFKYLEDRAYGPCKQKLELNGKLEFDLAARRDRVRELLSRLAGGTKR